MVSKKTLEQLKVGKEQLEYWLAQKNTAPVTKATLDFAEDLKKAPIPALYLISILSQTRLGDVDTEKTLIRHFRRYDFAKDTEIVLGHDLKDLATPLTNLYFAERLVSGEAKTWIKQVLNSPIKALLIADAMARMPKPVQGEPFYLFKMGLSMKRLHEHILRLRQHESADLNFAELTRSNLVFAYNMARIFYATKIKKTEVIKVLNPPGATRGIRNADVEAMIEWVAEKLTKTPTSVSNVPDAWIKLYRSVDAAIDLPAAKWKKVYDEDSRGYSSAEIMLFDLIPGMILAIDCESGQDLLEDLKDPQKHSHQIRDLLVTAPAKGIYRQADAAAFTNMILALANTNIANASETRALLKSEMHSIAQEMLRLAPRPNLSFQSVEKEINVDQEQDLFAELELQQYYEEWKPYGVAESLGPQTQIQPTNAREILDPYAEETLPLELLNPRTIYEVEFARPNNKFSGVQRFLFSARALEQMLKYESKEVSPASWLRAIKMGIAKSHGQRGIKILSFMDGEQTLFEVKLVQTPYRLLGRYQDGIWIVEAMVNTHP